MALPDPHAPLTDTPQGVGQIPTSAVAENALGAVTARRKWRRYGLIGAWIIAIFLALFMAAILWLALTAPLSRSLQPNAPPSITLEASDGSFITRKGAVIAKPVEIAKLPKYVPQAFIAIEDRRFYSHWGVDPKGVIRAMWHNVRAGGVREGGSTITQQLAKGAFLTSDRTAGRKIREVMIAFWLEAWLTKDQILERYLSNVYFGDNVYGLRAAARHYFNRTPENMTIAQAATLAAMLKAPSRLAPTVDLAGNRARAILVENAMVEAGFITPEQRAALKPAKLDVVDPPQSTSGTYFADWVLPQARDRAGDVYGSQIIKSTLDSNIQKFVNRAIRRAPLGKAQVAVVVMKPDGTVVAMAGGKSYEKSAYNRATQARRQPGSTFKLFVYLAAMRAGMTPDDMVDDTPITEGEYRPANSHNRYRGRITLRQAFAVSSNVAAVRIAQKVGIKSVIRAARDLGITTPLPENLSVALGSSGLPLIELAQAYASVAAGAYPVKAHGLSEQERNWLANLIDRQHSYSDDQLAMLRTLLSAAANNGTGREAALKTATFGKTGTSQDNRDAIFVGYAGGLVTAVWVGNDDNSPLPGVFGGGLPARIWRDIMLSAVEHGDVTTENNEAIDSAAISDAANALSNATIEGQIGNVSVRVDQGTIHLEGAGGLNIDLPTFSTPPDAPQDAPPPARARQQQGTPPPPPPTPAPSP